MPTKKDLYEQMTKLVFAELAELTNNSNFSGKFECWIEDGLITNYRITKPVGISNMKFDKMTDSI